MARYSGNIRDERTCRPVAGAQVYVRNRDGSAAVITDDGGNVIPFAVTDQYGDYAFNADDGFYDLKTYYHGRVIFEEFGVAIGTADAVDSEISWSFTAAAGQQVFNAPGSGKYPISVSLNGEYLDTSDYSRVGDAVTLVVPAFADSILIIRPTQALVTLSAAATNVSVNLDENNRPGSVFSIIRGTVTPDFYASVEGGTANATAAIRQAVNSGKHVELRGIYKITDEIVMTTPGQMIVGTGRQASRLIVPSNFNQAASSVLKIASGETGTELRDFAIEFYQPPTATVRSDLIQHPTAVVAAGSPRWRMTNCRIQQAWNAIDTRGNQGGATIDDLEFSAFNIGIQIDGALDTMRIRNPHFWPFGFANNAGLVGIFRDGQTWGMQVGRCDDFVVEGGASISKGGAILFYRGTRPGLEGNAFALLSGMDFDAYGGLYVDDGFIQVSNSFFSVGQDAGQTGTGYDAFMRLKSGVIQSIGNQFVSGIMQPTALIQLTGSDNTQRRFIDMGSDYKIPFDNTILQSDHTAGSAQVTIIGSDFGLPVSQTLSKSAIKIGGTNARVTFCDNNINDQGSGSSTFLEVVSDELHVITDNRFTGRGVSLPANYTQLRWNGNVGVAGNPGSGFRFSIANTTSVLLPPGYGRVVVTSAGKGTAEYLQDETSAALVSATGTTWVAPTATPASGKACVAWSGAAHKIYNNTGGDITVSCSFERVAF